MYLTFYFSCNVESREIFSVNIYSAGIPDNLVTNYMLIKITYNTYFQIDAKDSDLTLKLEVSHEKVKYFFCT